MTEIRHRKIQTNGISMQLSETGEGPLVLLVHGFPELAHSWRHQLVALAEAGYHAVAPDMRGYGQTQAPESIDDYSLFHLVGDLVGVTEVLGGEPAVLVGHDWGAIVAWSAPLFRPDRFRAVVGMSVPFVPRMPMPPTQMMRMMAGDRFVYILYFQQPGVAEAELDADPERSLRMIFHTASGERPADHAFDFDLPADARFLDPMLDPGPGSQSSWLPEEDFQVFVESFRRTGFRGGLNWYRNLDRNWTLSAPWAGAKLEVPALFVGGGLDPVVTGPEGQGNPMLDWMDASVPKLRGKHIVAGAGHWVQQEAPEEVNRVLLEFLQTL